jgi:uncharacterized glyoxalase superfamily protein PhnB
MPDFRKFVPVLKVKDLDLTIAYYVDVLGFEMIKRCHDEAGAGDYAMMGAGEVHLMLTKGAYLGGEPRFTGTLYIEVKGIDSYYESIKHKAAIVWPLENMEYGQREFGIKDCNGYAIAFAEECS